MTLGRAPDHAFAPGDQISQLGNFRMVDASIIGQREAGWVEGSGFRPNLCQDPRSLLINEPAEGALANRTMQQENARRMQ